MKNKNHLNNKNIISIQKNAKEFLTKKPDNVSFEDLSTLREILHFSDWRYYVLNEPLLADVEYDQLFTLLKNVENSNPDWITEDSPTHRIASDITESWNTVAHRVPMLSLDNSYNADDLRDWDRRCKQLIGEDKIFYTVEPKYDGAGISLIFKNDILQRGATRGNGVEGEDITKNIRQIKSIPLSTPLSAIGIQEMEIRGEVLIPLSTFKKINENRAKENLSIFANPRNAASGTLRMLNPVEVRNRGLKALSYHVSYTLAQEGEEAARVLDSHYDTIKWLNDNGFATPYSVLKKMDNIEDVIQYCAEFEEGRDDLDYEVDGMVIKVDSISMQKKLGSTSHHPRWAMAYKFKARQGTSILENVEFQVGRTGSITPVAKIAPLGVGGVIVTSVSLFNEDNIIEKNLHIGDHVLVERAGDVIPYIVKPLKELRDGSQKKIIFPKHCPECSEELFKEEGEVAWRCINASCPAQVVEHLIHFSSKNAMDIKNLGEANIKRFYDLGLLKNILSIYQLDFTKIAQLENFGAKSVENLKNAIENSKKQDLHRLIFGLGIRFVGETTAKILAKNINHLLDLRNWSVEQLMELEDIGPKVSSSIYAFFHREENIEMLENLASLGVNMQASSEKSNTESALSNKTFLFTGALQQLKRKEAEEMVEKLGAKVLSNVSKNLDYLIVGEKAGSKLKNAQKLGTVNIIEEQAFLDWMKELNSTE